MCYLGFYYIYFIRIVLLYTTPLVKKKCKNKKNYLPLFLPTWGRKREMRSRERRWRPGRGEEVEEEEEEKEEDEDDCAVWRGRARCFCDGGDRRSSELQTDLIPSLPPGCALRVASLRWGELSWFYALFLVPLAAADGSVWVLDRSFGLSRIIQPS